MAGRKTLAWVLAAGAALGLGGCLNGQSGSEEASVEAPAGTTRLVERDVEAPNVFSVSEPGLWDGRPSLGGVWVAYPGVKDPERVIIRNPENGKFVIGALFRREEVTPEPALPPAQPVLDAPETIATESLDPAPAAAPVATAAAPSATAAAAAPPPAKPAAAPAAPAKPAAPGGRNLIQIGIFSVEANAKGAAEQIRKAGASAEVKREASQGKTFWRVVAGPATDAAGREALMAKVKAAGFKDAYFVAR